MAIEQRQPAPGGTTIHSDQGTQFTSWAFTRRAIDSGLLPSMGSVGDCYDNAMIGSFWSRMQVELLDRQPHGETRHGPVARSTVPPPSACWTRSAARTTFVLMVAICRAVNGRRGWTATSSTTSP
jgi:transposase InsO family protein